MEKAEFIDNCKNLRPGGKRTVNKVSNRVDRKLALLE